jgi:hypothetical protein
MKNIFIAIAFIFSFSTISAQSDTDMWELTKTDLKIEYKSIIVETLLFTDSEAEVFWPIFNNFMDKKNQLLDQTMKILKEYSDNYDTISEDTIEDLINQSMDIDFQRLKIRKAYYKKLVKVLPKRKAGKLYQIDNQISTLLEFQIISQVPILE